MNIGSLSALSSRKRQLNQMCASAVLQQISQNKFANTQHRKRRRYLAKQVPLQQYNFTSLTGELI